MYSPLSRIVKILWKNYCYLILPLLFFSAPIIACSTLPGIDAILATPKLKYLVVGEPHGTEEVPLLLSDILCHALIRKHTVMVGLEWPETANDTLQAYLNQTANNPSARSSLISALGHAMLDGRGSQAMFRLLEEMRILKHQGTAIKVTPFQSMLRHTNANAYEKKMAENVISAGQEYDLVLVLVGNVHALQDNRLTGNLVPMAAHLPRSQTITMNTLAMVGEAWGCRSQDMAPKNCKPWPLLEGEALPRGINWGYKASQAYDAGFSVGRLFTASPPAQ